MTNQEGRYSFLRKCADSGNSLPTDRGISTSARREDFGQYRGISGFLREVAELRHSSFTEEEKWRMSHPRSKSQAERILELCSRGNGLRESIAAIAAVRL